MNLINSRLNAESPVPAGPAVSMDQASAAPQRAVILQYLRLAHRWRWVIVGATAACLFVGLLVTLFMTPQYTATSTIEISRDSDHVTNFQGVERETSVADQEFYQTEYGLLRARTLAERVAAQLRLIDDPKFFSLFDAAEDDPAFKLENGHYPAKGRNTRQRIAAEVLLEHLSIDPTRLSRLVSISFSSPDPQFSVRVADSWAENFIQTNLERKVQATAYGRDQLQRQLVDYKQRLDESQRQLVGYASKEGIINLPAQTGGDGKVTQERSIVADNLATLNTALAQATAARIAAQALYNQASRSGVSTEALRNQAINSLRERRAELAAQYEKMMASFEPSYPAAEALKSQIDDLDNSIAREEDRVSNSLQGGYREALQRERALKAKVNSLKSAYLDLRRRSIQYNIYQQEVDTNRALYDGLLQRFKEIGVAGGVGVNNVSIVDPADLPQEPSSPRLLFNLLIATVFGLGLGAAIAFALEQMDETIADPSEVERLLEIPLLGSVPKVEDEEPKNVLMDRKSELFDAYLAVQTNLAFTTEHGVPRSFAVTSTRPSEGKSTTALALATTLSRGGDRVILIDGDMRSPSVHQLGGVSHDLGLSNFLAGEDDIDSLIFEMKDLGFTAMSAGPIPPNAAELLVGSRLSVLIERLLVNFDQVIIDSPPVMGLADAPLIASRVEGIIFAIEAQSIRAALVKTALARLRSANARVIGCILTKFVSRRAHFGYGGHYEYGYSYGRDEESTSG
jgi:capsular exopolysaccharide synthesis family protein